MSDPGKTPQEKFDAEFEAFLREEHSPLAARYRRLPRPEPDAALDVRVLAQARQALHERLPVRSRARRWLPTFGAAATLVLVAGWVWRLAPPPAPPHETSVPSAVAPAAVSTASPARIALAAPPSDEAAPMSAAPAPIAASRPALPRSAREDEAPVIEPDPSGPARYRWKIAANDAPASSRRSGIYPPDAPPPPVWIEIVHRMLRDGHRDAARRALADLREHHPGFPLPADLRGLR